MIIKSPNTQHSFECVDNFQQLVSTPYNGAMNAVCWERTLNGDFEEIINKVNQQDNITILELEELVVMELSEQGQLARAILLHDWNLLKEHGASPILNVIQHYERDDTCPFFATDVYSYHVDRSPVPTHTFLCTYFGAASDILPNDQARQKILIPEIRSQLQEVHGGTAEGFDAFLQEHFFDLHYDPLPDAIPVNLGLGNMWRLAVDHPGSPVLPCVHRAPVENEGQPRLLMIC